MGTSLPHCCVQATRRDLLRARRSLEDAKEARQSALNAADQARRHLADSESGWRREADGLRVALNEALATANCMNEEKARPSEQREAPLQSRKASVEQISSRETPGVPATDEPAWANEGPQLSTSGVSDATSRDLAEELMQKLKDEANQRRHTRLSLRNEVELLMD